MKYRLVNLSYISKVYHNVGGNGLWCCRHQCLPFLLMSEMPLADITSTMLG